MSTSPKRRRSKPAGPAEEQTTKTTILYVGEDDFLRNIDDALAVTPPELVDPAMAAARLLVLRAIEDPTLHASLRARGRLVTVEVPGAEWAEPIAAAWEEVVLGGGGLYRDGGDVRPWVRRSLRRGEYMRFVRTGTEKSHRHDVGNADVAHAVTAGAPVVGFASNPARYLPNDLVRAADHRIVIPRLDGTMLAAIAGSTTGASCAHTLADDVCRRITPDDLRLARRVGQTPEDYLRRLDALATGHSSRQAIDLDALHGMDDAVAWGKSLAEDLAAYGRGDLAWSDVDRGCLLVGPPGTGKTTYAAALARTCGVPLVLGSLGRWQAAGHLGDLLREMRRTFEVARQSAPCILFIDEIDAFGDRASFSNQNKDYSVQVVNGFLEELDGVEGREGVVVIGAANHAERMDPAITRAGRLDRTIPISLPNQTALKLIYRHHLRSDLVDADLTEAARASLGRTGADVEQAVRGARRRARTARRPMAMDDLMVEICGEPRDPDPDARRKTIHEAAHAVSTAILRPGKLRAVTVRSLGDIGGATVARDDELPVLRQIEARLVCMMAGRAAERLFFGEISTGSGGDEASDLARATMLALQTIISYRMHGDGPSTWLGQPEARDIGPILSSRPDLAAQVDQMMATAEREADQFVAEHQQHIEVAARLLMMHESLSGADVEAIVVETNAHLEAKAAP